MIDKKFTWGQTNSSASGNHTNNAVSISSNGTANLKDVSNPFEDNSRANTLSSYVSAATQSHSSASELISSCKTCTGCGIPCTQTHSTPNGALCNSCFHHWRYFSSHRFSFSNLYKSNYYN